jgi:hypothetical protein
MSFMGGFPEINPPKPHLNLEIDMEYLMKRSVVFTLLALLLLSALTVSAETPPRHFDLPEEAVIFFARSVAEGDFEAALSAMDAKATAATGNYRALVERIQAIIPSSFLMAPEYPGYITLNQNRLRAQQGQQLYGFVLSLLVPEMSSHAGSPMMIKDGMIQFPDNTGSMSLDDFIARLNPENLSALTLRQVFMLNSAVFNSDSHQENIKKMGAIYGFTQQVDFWAVYELNGQLYRHACTAVKRPSGWQLSGLNSPLIGTSAAGIAEPITQEDAAALIDSADYVLFYDMLFN